MKIDIQTVVQAPLEDVWQAWNDPKDIEQWNAASPDWHTTRSSVDLRVGGRMSSRMEAKDGRMGFDFAATYTRVEPQRSVAFRLDDDREVTVEFEETPRGVIVRETFEAESENDPEMQREGWQAILDNFSRHVEAKMQRRT